MDPSAQVNFVGDRTIGNQTVEICDQMKIKSEAFRVKVSVELDVRLAEDHAALAGNLSAGLGESGF